MSESMHRAPAMENVRAPWGRRALIARFRSAAPFGQALLIGLLTLMAAGAMILLAVPFAEHYRILLVETPTPVSDGGLASGPTTEPASDPADDPTYDPAYEHGLEAAALSSFPDCAIERPRPDEAADWVIDCRFPGPGDVSLVLDALPANVELLGYHRAISAPDTFALASLPTAIALLLPLAVSVLLLRGVAWREDAARAGAFLCRRPWVLLLTPTLALVALPAFSAVLPEGRPMTPEMVQSLFPPLILASFVIAAPVFEEALFRHWAYRRTIDRLPVPAVALGSTWCFMLLHLFNPQVASNWAYLPTVFVIGLGLFWIRHRSGSILLAIGCHALHNLLAVAALLAAFSALD